MISKKASPQCGIRNHPAAAKKKILFINLNNQYCGAIYSIPNRHWEKQNSKDFFRHIRQQPKSNGLRKKQRFVPLQCQSGHRGSGLERFRANLNIRILIMYI